MPKQKKMWDNILTVIMTLLSLLWIYPIVLILLNSLKVEGSFTTSTVFKLPTAETFAGLSNYVYGVTMSGNRSCYFTFLCRFFCRSLCLWFRSFCLRFCCFRFSWCLSLRLCYLLRSFCCCLSLFFLSLFRLLFAFFHIFLSFRNFCGFFSSCGLFFCIRWIYNIFCCFFVHCF